MCPSGVSLGDVAAKPPGLCPALEIFDADCDGKIGREDLCSFYAGLSGDNIKDGDVIGTMISAADSYRDGYTAYEEFERVVKRQRMGRSGGGVMEDVFRMMDGDGDGDGKLSHEDIKGLMRLAGIGGRDKDVKAMVFLAGVGDIECGDLTYDVFLKILGVDDFF